MPQEAAKPDPRALTPHQAAELLGLDPDLIRRQIGQGAPTDGRGRIHLVRYAAWLIGRLAKR